MNYGSRNDVTMINEENFFTNIDHITESINLFNNHVSYPEMWDLSVAEDRINDGGILFLIRKDNKPLGHLWAKGNYLYNLFIDPKRENGTTQSFCQHCFNNVPHDELIVYSDEWNKRSIELITRKLKGRVIDEPKN